MPKFDKVKAAFVEQKDRLVAAKHLDVTTHAKAVRDDAVSIVRAPFRFVGDILGFVPAVVKYNFSAGIVTAAGIEKEAAGFKSMKELSSEYLLDAAYMPVRMIADLIHLTASLVGLVASVVVAAAKGAYKQTIGLLVGKKQISLQDNFDRFCDLSNQEKLTAAESAELERLSSPIFERLRAQKEGASNNQEAEAPSFS